MFIFGIFQTSAIFCLLVPQIEHRGGLEVATASILLLSRQQLWVSIKKKEVIDWMLWLSFGAAICAVQMESFWIPWIIACPASFNYQFNGRVIEWSLLPLSCPLWYLFDGLVYLSWAIFGVFIFFQYISKTVEVISENDTTHKITIRTKLAFVTCSLLLSAPFLTSQLPRNSKFFDRPPQELIARDIPGGFELQLPGQQEAIAMVWYPPTRSDRHHSLRTCLKYRGVDLRKNSESGVHTDGNFWFREFFYIDNVWEESHLNYLRRTIGFRTSPGIHVIVIGEINEIGENEFSQQSKQLVCNLDNFLEAFRQESQHQGPPDLSKISDMSSRHTRDLEL